MISYPREPLAGKLLLFEFLCGNFVPAALAFVSSNGGFDASIVLVSGTKPEPRQPYRISSDEQGSAPFQVGRLKWPTSAQFFNDGSALLSQAIVAARQALPTFVSDVRIA